MNCSCNFLNNFKKYFHACIDFDKDGNTSVNYPHANGSHIVIQMGGVYSTSSQEEGVLVHKHRDRNGRCIARHTHKYRGRGST